ncbi:DUF2911 domain-containing protein [Granulicella arctica]|uniref:DUF2911 domain-containing protein n=1 Tax=Granulicella arctica TaxID=940613 RepID=A0A7Y9PHG5_9BACT|nr:DUF2911 domain-containing protein [Granulicella arctica]NYF79218.1 hypothetical protein [Granulicella arctica]
MFVRSFTAFACSLLLTTAGLAQMGDMPGMKADSSKTLPSPPAKAAVMLSGKSVTIDYNSPHIRGRKIIGGLVPYGQVWRTGANPATTLKTAVNLKIGTLDVPAGTYTIYTLPNADKWLLIVNKQTGQWGTEYSEGQDLGRTPLTGKTLSAPQEVMSISFEHTSGASTELHIKWETTDEFVKVTAE